jgi:hypothetical protein
VCALPDGLTVAGLAPRDGVVLVGDIIAERDAVYWGVRDAEWLAVAEGVVGQEERWTSWL